MNITNIKDCVECSCCGNNILTKNKTLKKDSKLIAYKEGNEKTILKLCKKCFKLV